jgi:outer membrane protein TolC
MRLIITLLACFYSYQCFSQNYIDLDSAISLCFSGNSRIQYLEFEIKKSELLLAETKQQNLPDLYVNAALQKMDPELMEVYEGVVFGNEVTYNANVTLNQPLYQGGQFKNQVERNNIDLQISKKQRDIEKQNILLQLQIHFYSQLYYQRKNFFLKKKLEGIEQKLQSASNKLTEGVIQENDLSRVRIEKIRATKDIVDNEMLSIRNQHLLKRIIGLKNNDILVVNGKLDFNEYDSQIDSIILSELNSPNIEQYDLNIEKTENLLDAEKLKRLPSLSLYGSYTLQNPSFVPESYDLLYGYTIGLLFRMNLMESIKKSHKIEKLKLTAEQHQYMKSELTMELDMDKKIQIRDYYNSIENIHFYQEVLNDAEANLVSLQNQFEAGTSTAHNVVEQECMMYDIQIDMLLALLQYNIAKATLICKYNLNY